MFGKGVAAAVADRAKATDMSTAAGKGRTDDGWVRIQKHTFTNWVNVQLKTVGTSVEQVEEDFQSGVKLIMMLEVISGKKFGRYQKNPKSKHHMIENLVNAFAFMKQEGINLVNIQAEDLNDGNLKLVLGLLWTIIYHYQIRPKFAEMPANTSGKKSGFKDLLLEWVQEKIPHKNITNFNKDWQDGTAICALVNAVGGNPPLVPGADGMNPSDKVNNARAGIEAAKESLGVPALIAPEDMTDPAVDDLSIITYVSYFKGAKRAGTIASITEATKPKCLRSGCGNPAVAVHKGYCSAACGAPDCARDGCKNQSTPAHGKFCSAACAADPCAHSACNNPSTPEHGKYCSAACAQKDAPAPAASSSNLPPPWERSPNWREYKGVDLGGRCKICVYFSSTTSSQVIRKNTQSMMGLLEREKVHLRPDFQPWIPIDVDMSKDKRDAIFAKAGTKITPMLFIDDEYIGDYERVMELNESGELSKLLAY